MMTPVADPTPASRADEPIGEPTGDVRAAAGDDAGERGVNHWPNVDGPGGRAAPPPATRAATPAAPIHHDGPASDESAHAVAVERAWVEFQGALERSLSVLDDGQYLVLCRRGTNRFVQFAADHESGLHVEAVSAAYLGDDAPDEARYQALLDGGWLAPTHRPDDEGTEQADPHGSVNWFVDHRPPVGYGEVAAQACAVLRGVYEVEHPDDLEYAAGEFSGAVVLLPTLGLHRAAAHVVDGTAPVGALREEVEATLRQVLGTEELVVDADGDIPIREGSAMVFVRVVDDPPLVQLFSPLLIGVTESLALHRRLSELTRQRFLVRFHLVDETVLAGIDLLAEPFVPAHLGIATALLTGIADEIDTDLQAEFGGRVFFGDEARPKPPKGTGGYL